ncbi:hypothetical protein [Lichenifustis flavocetrariae]|uniref:Uncharacterized protein n=1 Tax=Lichenifustis flavocetrariae TaxID=2949735 RepID=A0AA41YUF9_9HYPH|nr:hypothetical protein [Lichenifustis flavocetrariae]MCW6508781.1 hypothetical protein [Lichenifustis flavocetrariae]
MKESEVFGLSVVLALSAWAVVCATTVWPRLRGRTLAEAAQPILILHLFRFVGLSFLIPGVAGPSLSRAFAEPGAYGDLLTVFLAWVALGSRRHPFGVAALWAFNVWGTLDLLYAFYKGAFGPGFQPSFLGATFYIPTVYVPLLLCTHAMLFVLLLRPSRSDQAARVA